MSYSSIVRKKCKCGCGKWPTIGFGGFNADCKPELKAEKIKQAKGKQRKRNAIVKDGRLLRKEDNKLLDGKAAKIFEDLQQWYRTKDKESTGACYECGEPTCKGNKTYWKYTICHIFAKSIFPSIQSHSLNHVELCHFGNSHHANMDNNGYEYVAKKMPKTWALIIERANILYPLIKEKSKIPDIIMQEIETKHQQ